MVAPTTATPATTVVRFSSSETKATMSSMCAAASRLERPAPPTARARWPERTDGSIWKPCHAPRVQIFYRRSLPACLRTNQALPRKTRIYEFFGRFELLTPSPTS